MTKEELAEYLEELLQKAGHRITKKVAKAIAKAAKNIEEEGGDIYDTIKLSRETQKILDEAKAQAERVLAQEWENVIEHEHDKEALIAAGVAVFALKMNPHSKHYSPKLEESVNTGYRNVQSVLSRSLLDVGYLSVGPVLKRFEAPTTFYNRVVTDAINDIRSGRKSYEAVVKKAVRDLTRSGLRYADYQSGHTNRIDVAVSRAVLTEISHIQGDIAMENAQELGTEYFEVDWHAGARPDHQAWQGKVYTMKELEDVCGLGTATGLKGVNCYHQIFPFIKGISQRNYTDAWLREQNRKENTPATFDGKQYTTYEARQKQREMETAMRIQREKITILKSLGLEQKTDRAKYSAQRRNYETFSSAMGEKTHYDRVYRDGLGRV